jgi:ATP-dependent Lon protease
MSMNFNLTKESDKNEIDTTTSVIPTDLPVLPLRDVVLFPFMIFPVLVGRESSLKAAYKALEQEKFIFITAQKDPTVEEPGIDDVYHEGTVSRIVQILKLPNGLIKILVDGTIQAHAQKFRQTHEFMEVEVHLVQPEYKETPELDAHMRHLSNLFSEYVKSSRNIPSEVLVVFENIKEPIQKLYYIAANLVQSVEVKQRILRFTSLHEQLYELSRILSGEIDILKLEQEIDTKVHDNIQRSQRKFFIQEQIRILQNELGEDEASPEIAKLREEINAAGLPEQAYAKAEEELNKLKKIPTMSPEYTVSRNYLDWIVSIPWKERSEDHLDIHHVKKILDEDHYGLDKPKDRIIEHIAVLNLVKQIRGQILCFVGPPGVGKTSLGRSIARALNRKFVRFSLGGIRDEAEIRGHRRTYIGSMPGKIIQSMKRAGTVNPVMLLDEVDKLTFDFHGDPASALLEVLDPEQNHTFADHYIEVDYDLSNVLFITTANIRHAIPLPLQDRMEIIELPGYLAHEKIEIARRHIIPKQIRAHGLKPTHIKLHNKSISKVIEEYTKEAGVRNLEREIATLIRKSAKDIVVKRQRNGEKKIQKISIDPKKVEEYLGVSRYLQRPKDETRRVGIATGLAWTSIGGELLSVEAIIMDGKERLNLTGKLGDVMKESAHAALSYIRSNARALGIEPDFYKGREIHIHLPEGAIPKDGPSAGLTMTMAVISAIANRRTDPEVAMTGEITLRGKVLAIGGLTEKLLAAKRHGIKKVLIPKENEKYLVEIPDRVKTGLQIIPISTIIEALEHTFVNGGDMKKNAAKKHRPKKKR